MGHQEIREKFRRFFESKNHKWVESSSLLPNDPSVLFTTAGMQQFKPYYVGAADPMKDFGSLNTVSIQKSIRTSDIDEVGDDTHDTFFEMLGNFSFGGYFKKEAITWAYEFITQELGLPISYVTVFSGSEVVPKDEESKEIWRSLGVADVREEGMEDVFWGPTGSSGPCGPTTEIYCRNASGQDVEVWNIVFNEFFCDTSREDLLAGKANLKLLPTKGIDTGMGLERLAMIAQKKTNIFDTDLFSPIMDVLAHIPSLSQKRIVADHVRASTFLISDGVRPSNKDQGYILRRLLRRAIVHLTTANGFTFNPFQTAINEYKNIYSNLDASIIGPVIQEEEEKFSKTVRQGLKELEKLEIIDSSAAFKLYESYGLPYEILKELGGDKASTLTREAFDEKFKEHQEKSRAGAEKKFGGHGLILDTGELKASTPGEMEKVIKLHTSTHLLHASLRKVLGEEVHQAGSDITAERLRFDFTFPRKLTPEEISQVEEMVNGAIQKDYTVTKEEMPYEEAVKTGALSFFKLKYPPVVSVYSVGPEKYGDSSTSSEPPFSRELCGGPHVERTGTIGSFKITKEEAVSAGVRRIRATIS